MLLNTIPLKRFSTSIVTRSTLRYTPLESFKIWWDEIANYDEKDLHRQTDAIKQFIPYFHDTELVEHTSGPFSYAKITHLDKQKIPKSIRDKSQWFLNEIKGLPDKSVNNNKHVVLLHGFAASSMWWGKNIPPLVENGATVHALDMLGFGLSGRPKVQYPNDFALHLPVKTTGVKPATGSSLEPLGAAWKDPICTSCGGRVDGKKSAEAWCNCGKPKIHLKTKELIQYLNGQKELVEQVEDIYVESLEQWRIANNIEKFHLVGHSFGGYMGISYALKYPERVEKIVLASPGGMERSPWAISNPLYKQLDMSTEDSGPISKEISFPISNDPSSYNFLGRYFRHALWFRDGWNWKISLFALIRWAGPFGPTIVCNQFGPMLKKANITDPDSMDKLIKYIYSTFIRKSFSETSICRVFDATIVGKIPILDKIKELKVKDSLFLFGQYDFMYSRTGKIAADDLRQRGLNSQFEIISNSGHNIAMDNYKEFNLQLLKFLNL
ncbi:alpha/beta hydrolase family protein [Martiniozyma asiatica (nom. inval.)]|nr:alpha/beta hydrolase family protein [Martiniozyma asiatica]